MRCERALIEMVGWFWANMAAGDGGRLERVMNVTNRGR